MGVGDPASMVEAVALGVDQFDCVMQTRLGRHGTAMTSAGKVHVKNAAYRLDDGPIDPLCGCAVCATHSRGYLRHLFQAGEILFSSLATRHNLQRYLDIMGEIRQSILLGRFPLYLNAVRDRHARAESGG